MVKINQNFKVHWLTIILSFGLILMTIVLINKNKEINRLAYEISDFEDKVSTLENEKEELESELEDCKSENLILKVFQITNPMIILPCKTTIAI